MRDPPSEQTAVQRTLQQGLQHGRTCLKMVSGRHIVYSTDLRRHCRWSRLAVRDECVSASMS